MMNLPKYFLATAILLSSVYMGFAQDEAQLRIWETRDGTVLEAKLLKRETNTMYMEDEEGGQFKIAFSALSLGDQQFVAGLNLPNLASENAVARHIRISSFLGETLETVSGVELSSDVVDGKVLGIYVSAKDCEPCAEVTSNLLSYVELLAPEYHSRFQIVYVGADTELEDEKEYVQEHGLKWLFVPFESEAKVKLLKRFRLNEAPALLFVKYDGTVLDKRGLRVLEKNDIRMLENMIKKDAR